MWSYHISILVPLSTARVSLEFDRRRLIVSRSVRDLSRSVSDCISLPLRRCSFKAEKGESMRFRSTETIYLDKVRLVGHLVDIPDQDKLISWFLLDHRNLCQSRAKGRDPLLCEEKYCTDLKTNIPQENGQMRQLASASALLGSFGAVCKTCTQHNTNTLDQCTAAAPPDVLQSLLQYSVLLDCVQSVCALGAHVVLCGVQLVAVSITQRPHLAVLWGKRPDGLVNSSFTY
ncbi:hypothetical protein RRG08_056179 [Elysia crispata]|uniref:Uncharacterized protein n=1 Tax=Elysia crispata TaxID=231223 RepID=A0AAE1D8K8_9GAST|nr:hypothetical protein RRG08_056179 [Elysia crispata]